MTSSTSSDTDTSTASQKVKKQLKLQIKKLRKKLKADLPLSFSEIKKRKNEILVLSFNIRSMINKLEELENIILQLDPDIICLTETWLDDTTPKTYNPIDGYTLIRKDRTEEFKTKHNKKKGGGVAILHKNKLRVDIKPKLCDDVEDILWVQVKTKQPFLLGTIYKPKYSDITKETRNPSTLEDNIMKAQAITKDIIINGDLNIDMRKKKNPETKKLNEISKTHNLKQLIKKTTRINTSTNTKTIIDHIWTQKDADLINESGTCTGLSDHMGTYMKIDRSINNQPRAKIKVRCYKNYKKEDFANDIKNSISQSKLENLVEKKELNKAALLLTEILNENANKHAPIIEITPSENRKPAPWYNDELQDLIRYKNKLIADSYIFGKKLLRTRITKTTNKIKSKKRTLKTVYIKEEIKKAGKDNKKLWKLLNILSNRKKQKKIIQPSDITQEKANALNKVLANIGKETQEKIAQELKGNDSNTKSSLSTISPTTIHSDNASFIFTPETEENVGKIIDNIKTDAATGYDNIGPKIIKDIKEEIVPILTKLINLSYEINIFPDCYKTAVITPIYKNDDPEDICNYRPISVLPTLSKILERSASDQIAKFLELYRKLSKSQHAYRKKHGTITCLADLLNLIYKRIDQKQLVAILSLDLSKAFDCINHQLLLEKLKKLGLNENSTLWIKSYLENRFQKTKFEFFTSEITEVLSGVPQGSILGPLLFLCFVNDLPEDFKDICSIFAYADDTQLVVTAKTPEELKDKIRNTLQTAHNWYQKNLMKINPSKTELLILNQKKIPNQSQANAKKPKQKIKKVYQARKKIKIPQIKKILTMINNKKVKIKTKPHIKVLGVFIDQELNWNKHIKHVKKKSMDATYNLHRINHLLPIDQRLLLYNAITNAIFNYADIIYGGCSETDSKKLQIVQNFAAKSITGRKKRDSATAALKELKFLTLKQRRIIHESVFIHKILLDQKPESLYSQYLLHFSKINTRQSASNKLNIPRHSTAKYKKSPLYRTIKAWNDAPLHLPKDNAKKHKTLFQQYLINSVYQN